MSHNAYFHSSVDGNLVIIVASNRIDEPLSSELHLTQSDETLYAVQVGDTLVENISSQEFSTLPAFAQPRTRSLRFTSLGFAVMGITALTLLVGYRVDPATKVDSVLSRC